MKGSAFDRGEQFILRGMDHVPPQRNPSQLRVDQDRAVAIIPAQPQQPGLSRPILLQPPAQLRDLDVSAPRNGFENIARSREPSLDPGIARIHATGNHTTHARNQRSLPLHGDDASRRPDHINYVALPAPRADGIPVGIERAHGNRNTRSQAHLLRPRRSQMTRQCIRGVIFATKFVANAVQQRIHAGEKRLRGSPSHLGFHIHL